MSIVTGIIVMAALGGVAALVAAYLCWGVSILFDLDGAEEDQ